MSDTSTAPEAVDETARAAARRIGRALFNSQVRAEGVDLSDREALGERWKRQQRGYVKLGMSAVRALQRDGFRLERSA